MLDSLLLGGSLNSKHARSSSHDFNSNYCVLLISTWLGSEIRLVVLTCGGLWLSGSDATYALGQASLSPMSEGEGSIPVWDVGFSPLMCDTD